MGKRIEALTSELEAFIKEQRIFFVGTAMKEGTVNVSPKGMDSFRVLSPNKIIWLNVTGSGNETATHIRESDRMTVMFCAFEGKPMILRLYGHAVAFHERDEAFQTYIKQFPAMVGTRQIFEMTIDLVQTSCGMAVPYMDFKEERTQLNVWAEKQGEDGLIQYRNEKNMISLDGHPTGINPLA